MAFCLYVLRFHFIAFFIVLAISMSNGEDANYAACSFSYSCGSIQNVGYPFWGGQRPDFCGIPDFKLNCQNEVNTTMNVFSNTSDYLGVRAMNMSSHTISVSQEKLFDRCHLSNSKNATWLSTLKPYFALNISLFYNCTNVSKFQFKSLNCSYNDDGSNNGTAYYFSNPSDISSIRKSRLCQNNVTFAVDKRSFNELKSIDASLSRVLNKFPIVMEYKANFTACSRCEESGGRCGSGTSIQTSDQFVCYCRHAPQPLVCPKSEKKLEIILGLGVGGGVFVLVGIIVIWLCMKLKCGHSKLITRSASLDSTASELNMGVLNFGVPLFSYSELAEATDNFDQSNEVGNGGFGIVYCGKLKDGRAVAVKRLYEKSYRRMGQFMNEIQILTRLRHQNLVSLYGCTSKHSRELILVYEYVKNGTVADHLYDKNSNSRILPWPIRLRIAIETATALSYLHASDIIHRDVKTNNILLDSNFCVKVADFGLSRLFPTDVTHVSTAPQGTPGYLDPEYHLCYKLTDKSDVYSFGVVLIELISALPAINMDREKLEINLANFAMNRIQRCAFDELVDPQLGFALDYKVRKMTTLVAELAFQCLQHDKEFRPSMDEVLQGLKRIESGDYEALRAEEMRTNEGEEISKVHRINHAPPHSPTENDQAQLLHNRQVYPTSPISVIDKWTSKSSTSSSSK